MLYLFITLPFLLAAWVVCSSRDVFLWVIRWCLARRYQVECTGDFAFDAKKTYLVIPNHPAVVDPLVLVPELHHHGLNVCPLVDESFFSNRFVRHILALFNAVRVPDFRRVNFRPILKVRPEYRSSVKRAKALGYTVLALLTSGKNVLLYPSGHITADGRENLGNRQLAYNAISQLPSDVEVIAVRIRGLFGIFSIEENTVEYNADTIDKNDGEVLIPKIEEQVGSKEDKKMSVITLTSYYKKRVDFGDITTSFYEVYEKYFCEYFGITRVKDFTTEYNENMQKLANKRITFDLRKKDSILTDVHIDSTEVDNEKLQIDFSESLVGIDMSESDLQYDFEKVIKNNLNGFAQVRSVSTVKMAIINTFTKYLNIKPANKGIILIQNLIINNSDKFGEIINIATEKYKPIHELEVDQKVGYELNENWHIPMSKNYNPNTNIEIDSNLSIHQPFYMETKDGKVDQLEVDFIKYLDKHDNTIEYFWKNGSEHMNTNFNNIKKDGSTFQPDFLIQFKDGRIGIFDTKAGKGFNENDNKEKSEALIQYIVDENKKGKNLIGGLVIKDNDKWLYYDRGVYSSYKEEPSSWFNFNDLLK